MNSCVFCKIIHREIPASFIYEDEICIAFLDIHPMNEGHTLVIPKQHNERFSELHPKTAGHLLEVGHKILRSIEKSEVRCEGANLFLSDGAIAGQEVMHSHLHIAPRFKGDGQRVGFSKSISEPSSRAQLDETAKKIREHIN